MGDKSPKANERRRSRIRRRRTRRRRPLSPRRIPLRRCRERSASSPLSLDIDRGHAAGARSRGSGCGPKLMRTFLEASDLSSCPARTVRMRCAHPRGGSVGRRRPDRPPVSWSPRSCEPTAPGARFSAAPELQRVRQAQLRGAGRPAGRKRMTAREQRNWPAGCARRSRATARHSRTSTSSTRAGSIASRCSASAGAAESKIATIW